MAERLGTIYVELDLDYTKFEKGQQRILSEAKATSLSVEKNWRTLGEKSDVIYNAMANGAINAYNMIANRAKTSATEQFRAQSAMIAKINTLNNQMAKNPLYETLGIKSVAAIESQKKAIISSYNTIKASDTATAQDLVNIERAKNNQLKQLNKEMVGSHELSMASMMRAVFRFYAAYYVASTAIQGVFSFVMSGVKAIDDLKVSTIAVAAQITSMQGTTGNITENYKQNLKYAEALNLKLMEIDAHSLANLGQIMLMNRALAGQGVVLDLNKEKQIESFTALTNAVAMLTTEQDKTKQASQEIRALMSGQVRPSDMVAQMINDTIKRQGIYKGGLKEIVKLGKQHGDTLERLQPYLTGVVEASGDISMTWESVSSSLETSWGIIQRALFKDIYKNITEGGRKAAEWARKNADEIVEKIYSIGRAIKFAGEITLVYFGILASIKIYTSLWAAYNAAIVLSNGSLLAGIAGLYTWTVSLLGATVAVTTFGAAVKTAFTVFTAGFVGWEIGTLLSNNFEIVREAGVHMVYGIADVWSWFVRNVKMDWERIKAIAEMSKALFTDDTVIDVNKRLNERLDAIQSEYEKEKALRVQNKKEQLNDESDAARAAIAAAKAKTAAMAAVIKTPKIKGIPEEDEKAIARAKRLAESWQDMKRTLEGKIAMEGLDDLGKKLVNIRLESEKLIEKYKSIPGAVDLIKKVQVVEERTVKKEAEEAKYKPILEDIKKARFEIENFEKTQLEKDIATINAKAAEYKDKKIDEVTIARWAALEKQLAEKQAEKKAKEESEKFAKEKADAYRTMHDDMKDQTQEYYNFQVEALQKEADNYFKLTNDKVIVDKWHLRKKKELDRELALSGDNFYEGAKAQYEKMIEDQLTWGKAGAKTMEDMSSNMQQTFSSVFMDAWDGKLKTAQDYFAAFKRSIAQMWADLMSEMIAQWIRQQIITGLMTLASAGVGGGAGSGFAALGFGGGGMLNPSSAQGGGFTSAFLNHGGWAADDYAQIRTVPSSFFNNAPRYHSGIGPDERPAIIRKDEGVFTPGQMKALGRKSPDKAQEKTEVRVDIANIVTPEMLDAYMASPSGKNAVLNVLSTNSGKVSRIIRAA